MAGNVVSAAILEGQLIIGLDDGSIIRAGYVQGPQGLKGDPGPVGATGSPGTDGNTIITVGGTPRNDAGVDGDYAIDNINWRIYGPKSGGVWGKAKEMLPGKEMILENGRTQSYSGATGGGGGSGGTGGGGPVFTSTVIATGTGRLAQEGTGPAIAVSYPGSPLGIISPESGMGFQSNINAFFVKALEELEVEIPVAATDTAPTLPQYEGKLWFDTNADELTLYVYYDGAWVPAAPPVSLDGINATIDAALIVQNELLGRVAAGETAQTSLQGTVSEALNTQQEIQADILTLQQEVDALEDTRYVGTWNAIDDSSKNGRPPGDGNFYFNQGALATDWNLVGWIYIANVDSNGITFTHSDIEVGDQIEVISKTETSYGIYTIQDTTDAGDYVAIQIETMNRSDGIPATGEHLIKIFSIDTGLDLNEADDRYMKLRGNQQLDKDVTFRLRQNDSTDANKTFIAINDGEMNLYHVADPAADTHAANQKYVDEQRDTRLPLTGGMLTGDLAMNGNKITALGTPTADAQAANKGYVDGKVGEIVIPDLSGYLQKSGGTMTGELGINRGNGNTHILFKQDGTNKAKIWNSNNEVRLHIYEGEVFKIVGYVNGTLTQLLGVSSSGFLTLANVRTPTADSDAATKAYADAPRRPPGLRFLYTLDDPAPATKFRIYTSSGTKRMQISGTSRDFKWLSTNPGADMSFDEGHRYTIYYNDGDNGWRVKKTGTYKKVDYHANDIVVHFSSELNSDPPLNPGAEYYIHLAGMF